MGAAEQRRIEKAAKEAAKAKTKKYRQRLRALHESVKDCVSIDQVNEVCLQKDDDALKALGDAVDKALKKESEEAVTLFHAAIQSLGLTPIIPKDSVADDEKSTCSGGVGEESVEEAPSPEKIAEMERREAEREKQRKEQERRRQNRRQSGKQKQRNRL